MFSFITNFIGRRYNRRPVDKVAHRLYVSVVDAARNPALYTDGGVADTLDGRFDMIALHLALVMERLQKLMPETTDEKPDVEADAVGYHDIAELQVRLLEIHFADMDQALREMGVGDLGVGKKVKAMASAVMGRRQAYEAAFAALDGAGDRALLEEALVRNAFRGKPSGVEAVNRLAEYAVARRRALAERNLARIWTEGTGFETPEKV